MRGSLGSADVQGACRLESLRLALIRIAEIFRTESGTQSATRNSDSPESLVFAYIFGMKCMSEAQDFLSLVTLLAPLASLNGTFREILNTLQITKIKDEYLANLQKEKLTSRSSSLVYRLMWRVWLWAETGLVRKKRDRIVREIREKVVRGLKYKAIEMLLHPCFRRVIDESMHRLVSPVEELIRAEEWDRAKALIGSEIQAMVNRAREAAESDPLFTASQYPVTLPMTKLAWQLEQVGSMFGPAAQYMFGKTPMCSCLMTVAQRFQREERSLHMGVHRLFCSSATGDRLTGTLCQCWSYLNETASSLSRASLLTPM
jgi:hypothetical protein